MSSTLDAGGSGSGRSLLAPHHVAARASQAAEPELQHAGTPPLLASGPSHHHHNASSPLLGGGAGDMLHSLFKVECMLYVVEQAET